MGQDQAQQGLVRIGELFKVEASVNGRSALRRRRMRQTRTAPVLTGLKSWMNETLAQVSVKSPMAMYTLLGTAGLNGISPQRYLHHVLERIADQPSNRIDELLPWVVAAKWEEDAGTKDMPLARPERRLAGVGKMCSWWRSHSP